MILLGEAIPAAAEVPFFLPLSTDPINSGLTGHSFSSGEVVMQLPGGAFFNVSVGQIVEKGFGQYAVQLNSGQTGTAGTVYIRAVISGAQPYTGTEEIANAEGEIFLNASDVVPFFLPNATDPVNGSPVTGHSFSSGEIKVCLPGSNSFINATVGDISEVGHGLYELAISGSETATRGKIYLFAFVSGSQRYGSFESILPASSGSLPTPTIDNITPTANTTPGTGAAFSADFSKARTTQITFDLHGIPSFGCDAVITISYADRNEVYTAYSNGEWLWPFDVQSPDDNSISTFAADPAHVTLLPRGGWPPCIVDFDVSASIEAVPV